MGLVTAAIASTVAGAGLSKYAADKQKKAIRRGEQAAQGFQREMYEQSREDLAPYREFGQMGMNALADPRASFEASPGYEFARTEGMRGIDRMFNARTAGGNALQELAKYGTGLAQQDYGNWWNRQFGIAQLGAGAAGQQANVNQQTGMTQAGIATNAATDRANVSGQYAANINNAMQQGIGNYLYYRGQPGSNVMPDTGAQFSPAPGQNNLLWKG